MSGNHNQRRTDMNHFTRPFGLVADGAKIRWSEAGFYL